MQKAKNLGSICAALLIAALVVPALGARQTSSTAGRPFPQTGQTNINPQARDPNNAEPPDPMKDRFEAQAAKARNTDRFKRIQSDTAKLLQLSTELKADVDKTTKNEMSLDVIRKAAEVEKLAHDVKERMKS